MQFHEFPGRILYIWRLENNLFDYRGTETFEPRLGIAISDYPVLICFVKRRRAVRERFMNCFNDLIKLQLAVNIIRRSPNHIPISIAVALFFAINHPTAGARFYGNYSDSGSGFAITLNY